MKICAIGPLLCGGLLLMAATTGAMSAGALAVGTSENFPRDGIGVAGVVNKPDRATAIQAALEGCRSGADSPAAGSKCEIIATFSGQCFAFSGAKRSILVGHGWGLGQTKDEAMAKAISKCRAMTAPSDRALCSSGFSACDTSGSAD